MNAISHNFPRRHGRGGLTIEAKQGQFLDTDALRGLVPAMLKTEAHSSRSQRFQVIETHELLDRLAGENFVPVKVQTGGSKDKGKLAFTKHLIRLRQRDAISAPLVKGDSHPEIIIANAHDGTSSYAIMAGLWRVVCANGLIVARENWGSVRVGHHGSGVLDKVIEGTYTVLDNAKQAIEHADVMRSIPMTHADELEFAEQAIAIRWPEDKPAIRQEQAIRAHRNDDVAPNGSNLWLTFNRVQENLVRGGMAYYHRTENNSITRRHTRPIKGVDGDVKLNRELWGLACDWAAAAGQPIAA